MTHSWMPQTQCVKCVNVPCLCATGFAYRTKGCPDCQGNITVNECRCDSVKSRCQDCGSPSWFEDFTCPCASLKAQYPEDSAFFRSYCRAIKMRRAVWHDLNLKAYAWCNCPRCLAMKGDDKFMELAYDNARRNRGKEKQLIERELSCPTCRRIFCKVRVDESVGPIDVVCEGCLLEGR